MDFGNTSGIRVNLKVDRNSLFEGIRIYKGINDLNFCYCDLPISIVYEENLFNNFWLKFFADTNQPNYPINQSYINHKNPLNPLIHNITKWPNLF